MTGLEKKCWWYKIMSKEKQKIINSNYHTTFDKNSLCYKRDCDGLDKACKFYILKKDFKRKGLQNDSPSVKKYR